MPLPSPCCTSTSRSDHSFNLYSHRLVLPVLEQHVNGIIQNILVCLARSSAPSTLTVKFIHLVTFSGSLLFFIVV